MSNIMFFCIPAHGHTNPTLRVVDELVRRGHDVRYYSFEMCREKIEATGAAFIPCDAFLPPVNEKQMKRIKKVSTTEMSVAAFETTRLIDPMISRDVEKYRPDCIVADSVCFWGKLIAKKYALPFVCSTTTFAFNRHSSQYIKNSFGEIMDMILGLPRMNRALRSLQPLGYHVKNALEVVQNDNDTNTIVYTSRRFQPCAETFSDRYAFIGPSVRDVPKAPRSARRLVYVSLGTVLSDADFYQKCLDAAAQTDADFILSVGGDTDIARLKIPANAQVYARVDQMEVLSRADAFITHCGMNSVSESLYMGVPMLLWPQTGEQKAVARRAHELGAGEYLTDTDDAAIRTAVETILNDARYAQAAAELSADLRACSGAEGGADFIEGVIGR